ncbi:MAG: mechanosensitive ion channel [Okeania sp. SIO3H1]|uniref:mechanosensitive ion channel family protein n=1 Tax=Okeania sp. SIO1I7 TaxID=2607772 RepID=UPI0013CAEE4C|nr:mechanosensitive ion channel domain-containing protein [Okeania sp. SIO1I7]NEN90823.1 mechanosensitive ion channel [Okeania sp. SIO3H1]NET25042.1 mechanosensitive ion channel [Okeania sp. SIO1I7]
MTPKININNFIEIDINSIIATGVEIVFIICLFVVIKFFVNRAYKQLIKVSSIKKKKKDVEVIYRNIQILLTISCLLLCLLITGFNGWLIYQGENLIEYQISLIKNISFDYLLTIGIRVLKILGILILTKWSIPYINKFITWSKEWAKNVDKITANDASIENLFEFFKSNFNNMIWLLYLTISAQIMVFPAVIIKYLYISLQVYMIIIVGLLFTKANTTVIDTLDGLSKKYSDQRNILRLYDRLSKLIPLAKRCLEYAIYITTATLSIQKVDFIAGLAPYGPLFLQIIGIIFMSRVVQEIGQLLLEEVLLREGDQDDISKQKRQTFLPLFQSCIKYLIYFGTGIAILYTFEIDATPILAGVGILGLTIGMGAQSLVEDIVAGFFILFESYYLVGDFVEINGVNGFVTGIELRTTRINGGDKNYIIHNRDVKDIVNHSSYSSAVVMLKIPYQVKISQVYEVIEKVGKKLLENYSEDIIEPTTIGGVKEFSENHILIEIVTEVKPGKHFRIQKVLGIMIKEAFEEANIELSVVNHVTLSNDRPIPIFLKPLR